MISVIVQTCDKYEQFWAGWFRTFTANWDFSLNWPIYFCNEEKDLPFTHPAIRQIKTGVGVFSTNYRRILERIDTPYFFYLMEDWWLHQGVARGLFAELLRLCVSHDMDCLRIHRASVGIYTLQRTDLICRGIRLLRFPPGQRNPYMVAHQAAIWKRSFAEAVQVDDEDPWRNELAATNRVHQRLPHASIYLYHYHWYPVGGVSSRGMMTPFGKYITQMMREEQAGERAFWVKS